jgi:hypothetical protein
MGGDADSGGCQGAARRRRTKIKDASEGLGFSRPVSLHKPFSLPLPLHYTGIRIGLTGWAV